MRYYMLWAGGRGLPLQFRRTATGEHRVELRDTSIGITVPFGVFTSDRGPLVHQLEPYAEQMAVLRDAMEVMDE